MPSPFGFDSPGYAHASYINDVKRACDEASRPRRERFKKEPTITPSDDHPKRLKKTKVRP